MPPETTKLSNIEMTSEQKPKEKRTVNDAAFDDPPYWVVFWCIIGHLIVVIFGHLRDFLRKCKLEKNIAKVENPKNAGFVPLYQSFEAFFTRNVYKRLCDAFNRPILGTPGTMIDIMDRSRADSGWTITNLPTSTRALNMGSYNYLGFAENSGPCTDAAAQAIEDYGMGLSASRQEFGTQDIHRQLELLVAKFVGCEEALTFGMGFATNSMNIPALVDKGCLIISDELNHSSLILGCRLSGASIRVFRHNDVKHLETVIRQAIIQGQPRKNRPWKKILLVVEGIYSMEGTVVKLPEILELKKKYKFYLYLDEAHSIGSFGPNGRGVVDYYNLDPNEVDIMMGTFTKSFGAAGGYVAGKKALIDHLRVHSHSCVYACSMTPPVVNQVISSMTIIMGLDGTNTGRERIQQLSKNTHYFRQKLMDSNMILSGSFDSPVVPMMTFQIPKIAYIARECLKRGLALVVVGYPATPLLKARVRFCISAKHTKEDLDKAVEIITDIGTKAKCDYIRSMKK